MPTQLNQVPEALQSDFILSEQRSLQTHNNSFSTHWLKIPGSYAAQWWPLAGDFPRLGREILSNAEVFGSFPIGIPANMEQRLTDPLESDAHEHRRYALLLPIFSQPSRLQTGTEVLPLRY